MIETDEQRRWWFATHPEYSWSRRGIRKPREGGEDDQGDRVRPEDVDAYVDRMLPYADGPLEVLLRSVKRNFGTEGESGGSDQSPGEPASYWDFGYRESPQSDDDFGRWDRGDQDVTPWKWGDRLGSNPYVGLELVGYEADDGAFTRRLPSFEELTRLPSNMARDFLRAFEQVLRNNPLLIDPNALERHHQLVKEQIDYFEKCGLDIEKYAVMLRLADHRLKKYDGLHTGEGGRGGKWNREWKEFIRAHPPRNTPGRQKQILDKLAEMNEKYEIYKKAVSPPERPGRR